MPASRFASATLHKRLAMLVVFAGAAAFAGPSLAMDDNDILDMCMQREDNCHKKCGDSDACWDVCNQLFADCVDHGGWSKGRKLMQVDPGDGPKRFPHGPMTGVTKPLDAMPLNPGGGDKPTHGHHHPLDMEPNTQLQLQ